MELLICGTGAAEAIPALFCPCRVCQTARERGGKEVRSRTGYMLGERIRIDLCPDTNLHAQKYDLALEKLEHLLITHAHWDHWVPDELLWRSPEFSQVPEEATLHIYGNAVVREGLDRVTKGDYTRFRLAFHEIEPFRSFSLPDGVTATPLPAAHDRTQLCVNYLLQVKGKTILQGHDTGWYEDETWEFLSGQVLDVVLLDSTSGRLNVNRGHLGAHWVVRARDHLLKLGALAADCRFFATHFSHNGGWLHTDLEAYYGPRGIEVAYDGLRLIL